jgi:hypothetical protein
MYNTFYRTTIVDQEARKLLDTFVGPTFSMASMMRIFRNNSFSLATRIGLGLFVPIPRARTLYLLQNFNFTLFKNTIFSELYLHQRIWRHIFENACTIIGSSTYYAVYRYKRAYLDQPSEKKKDEATTTLPPKKGSSFLTKKPNNKRTEEQPYQYNNYHSNLPGYVPIEETDDSFYRYKAPIYGNEESEYSYNQPSYPIDGYNNDDSFYKYKASVYSQEEEESYYSSPSSNNYISSHSPSSYNFADPTYNEFVDELPQAENKSHLSSFKSALSRIQEDGYLDSWASTLSPNHT